MKQSLDWFKHDATASESPKFIALRASPYGWAGEGRFWALNGLIARSDGCQLDLGRKFAKAGVADKLDLTPAELDAYLVFLRDECELVRYEDGIVTTSRLKEGLADVMPERERKARVRAASADKSQKSADKPEKSADAAHRAEAEADIEAEAEQEGGALFAFALKKAVEKGARSPEAMARKLAKEPDVIAEWEALKPKPPRNDALPEPPSCTCGGEIKADRWGGDGRCLKCGSWWRYDRESGAWAMDNEEF